MNMIYGYISGVYVADEGELSASRPGEFYCNPL